MKQKTDNPTSTWRRLSGLPMLTVASVLIVGMACVPSARAGADQYDQQIAALQQQNAGTQSSVSALQVQASTYQDAINKLQSQISQIQSQIDANLAKQADLQQQIDQAQKDLDAQKAILGADIKATYVDGQPTTIEMLASSNNLSDFVDKEEYRTAVQNKVQDTLVKITKLQNEIKDQKTQVDRLLDDQKTQQGQLSGAKAQQDQLLAMNEGQQSQYNQKIQANQSQIAKLHQQQIAANMAGTSGVFYGSACDSSHGDTYPAPLCSSGQDSLVDQWGLYNRECVSYVAWKEYSSGKYVPYGLGNAGDWPSNVPKSWIVNTPQAGDAAVRPTNSNLYFGSEPDVGHVMYIENVNSSSDIAVSQYNANLDGTYSYVSHKSTSGLVFIHFPNR